MYNPQSSGERRNSKRFPVKTGSIAFIDSNINLMGQIEDICKGGLAFRYLELGPEDKNPKNINLLMPKHNFLIEKMPIQVISDIEEMNKLSFSSVMMRRCGVRFNTLSDTQLSRLDFFIENYATAK